jgi:uncharacterized protein
MRAVYFALLCLVLSSSNVARAQFVSGPDCPVNPVMPGPEVIRDTMAKATDRGFLWRLEKDGKTSHVFGTVHLGQFEWMFPGPALRDAMVKAKAIALELNPMSTENQQFFAKSQRDGLLPIPPALAQRLENVSKALCVDNTLLQAVNQETLVSVLTLASARREGWYADYGSEVFMAGFAFGAKKPVVELENAALQSQALKTSMGGDPDWKVVTQWLDDQDSGKTVKVLKRMMIAWNTSDIKAFETYAEWCECAITEADKERMRLLNDERNDNLAARIMQEHEKSGGNLLAAIGTLHFTGPKAVQKLLAGLGFTVTRVVPN